MAHHGDAGADELLDQLDVMRAALELDRETAAYFDEATSVGEPLFDRRLIRHERHVADDVRPPHAANHRAAVVRHLFEGHRERGVVALDDHAERVADEQHVGAAFIEEPPERRVVRGQDGDLLASLFHLPKGVDGDALRLHSVPAFWVSWFAVLSRALEDSSYTLRSTTYLERYHSLGSARDHVQFRACGVARELPTGLGYRMMPAPHAPLAEPRPGDRLRRARRRTHGDRLCRWQKTQVKVVEVGGAEAEVRTAKAFRIMAKAASKAGIELRIRSGYRTFAKQAKLYKQYRRGEGNLAAAPGYSNHESGRALDIYITDHRAFDWLQAHGTRYGFHRTVPGEAWHWEYLGDEQHDRPSKREHRSS